MTTSQIQRRLVDFGFLPRAAAASFTWTGPSSPPSHPCHSLTHSLTQFGLFLLWKLKLTPHTDTHTHFITHTHTLLFCLLRPDSGCQRRHDNKSHYLGVISVTDTTLHTHTRLPSSSHLSSPLRLSLTHTLIHSVTSLSVNIAFLSAWRSEHKSPPRVNTLTVKTVFYPELRTKNPLDPAREAVSHRSVQKKNNTASFTTGLTAAAWSPDKFFKETLGVAVAVITKQKDNRAERQF